MARYETLGRSTAITVAALVAAIGAYLAIPAGPIEAQQQMPPAAQDSPVVSSYQSHSSEAEHAHSNTVHQYGSDATEANDAMLITAVKVALKDDGVTNGHAVVVDCDHSVVTITGAVGSAADAHHAAQVASSVDGVARVNNKLTW
ncbi:MAG TPA: BON domain-containing protein [Candidatus Binataceae bacterium]|nr:BON domain-containing protein [Candidatus Binataceae bacterium]